MYTELILGVSLKEDTPNDVIEALKYMIGEVDERPINFPLPEGRCDWLFRGASCYFGINDPVNRMWYDGISKSWNISTRSNIKNYYGEIEEFLKWIKPYVRKGSGNSNIYAITIYEEDDEPIIYCLGESQTY